MGTAATTCEKQFLKTQVGKTASVLFETYKNGIAEGYTENYTRVKMKSEADLSGKILTVRLTETAEDYCIAEK